MEEELRELLGVDGPPPGLAEAIASRGKGDGERLREFLIDCFAAVAHHQTATPAPTDPQFTETEALTIIVRILGVESGELCGDHVGPTAVVGGSGAAGPGTVGGTTRGVTTAPRAVAMALREESLFLAVFGLLRQRAPQFALGEEHFLQLEALRALRLLLGSGTLVVAGGVTPPESITPWWVEAEMGHVVHGETRRQLVATLLQVMQSAGDGISQLPRAAALGALWRLVTCSNHCRSHMFNSGGSAIVVDVLRAQMRLPMPPMEGALVSMCGVLAALTVGPRAHARRMGELEVDKDVLGMLRKYFDYRQIVAAAFVLLGVFARDETISSRLSAPEALKILRKARDEWSDDVHEAVRVCGQPMAPIIHALL